MGSLNSHVKLEWFSSGERTRTLVLPWAFAMLGIGIASAQVIQSGPVYLSGPESDASARPDTEIIAEQYLVLGSATRMCGESQVAVNPVNPDQMAVAAMCALPPIQFAGEIPATSTESVTRTPRRWITEFAVTRDRGLTWTVMEDPMRTYFHRYRSLDPFAAFAPDGTMILGNEAHFPETLSPEEETNEINGAPEDFGGEALIWSTDGGHTFSDPVQIISSYMPKEILGPFVSYARRMSQGDRPQIRVDLSNGKLYVEGSSAASDPPHFQSTFRMSKDRGRDWGMVYAFDAPEWPGGGGGYDVQNGIVGVAYVAASVPASLNSKCPCWVFASSTDDGKTFERHLIQGAPPPTAGGRGPGEAVVVADPAIRGMFSVWVYTAMDVESFVTADAGKTWSKAASLPQIPTTTIANLTASSSPKGVIALAWRVIYALSPPGPPRPETSVAFRLDAPFEVWSMISRDGGRTYSAPFAVSTSRSPGVSIRRGMGIGGGIEYISVAVDDDFAHFTWFDDRSGFRATWYGRVPLSNFE
jgi:hypothetical protein